MKILIIGGAGYIGCIMNRLLVEQGFKTTVFDNLSSGHRSSIFEKTEFIKGDMADYGTLKGVLQSGKFDVVMHFAAFSLVGESMKNPINYYQNNVANSINLIRAMHETGPKCFVFSSTAAVYGNPINIPITETHPIQPINPYGRSKAMIEQILKDLSQSGNLNFVSLRYFNAAGAHPDGNMGEDHHHETHLIPLVLKSVLDIKAGCKPLKVFGTDYDTPDGTCVRDYIHILDLAKAHMLAIKYLANGGKSDIFNLGNGRGFSVLEIIKTAKRITGKSIPFIEEKRRPGDPPTLIAASENISKKLGWKPEYTDLEAIIETAWKWHSRHPEGYRK